MFKTKPAIEDGAPPAAHGLKRALLDERVLQHQEAGTSAALASLLLALGLAATVQPFLNPALSIAALALLVATQGIRFALSQRHARAAGSSSPAPADVRRWLARYRAVSMAHGLAWGLYALALIHDTGGAANDLIGYATGALAAGALVTAGFDIVAAGGFVLLAAGPVVPVVFATVHGPHLATEAAMLAAVGLFGVLRARSHMRQTARRRVEAAVRATEARGLAEAAEAARRTVAEHNRLLNLLLATTAEGFWFLDTQGITQDLNPAMCRLLGRPREDVLGRAAADFFEGESLATLRGQIARRKLGEAGTYEVEIRRPDGSVVHCVNAASPLTDADGKPAGSVGIWTDITARRRAEQGLHAYERVANSIGDLVSVIGEDLVYRMVNDAWCRATGIRREDAIGRRSDEVVPRAFNDARRQAWDDCMRLREPRTLLSSVDLPALAGRIVETTYFPYDDPAGQRAVVSVNRDVTERESSRRQLAESAEYLSRTLNATGDGIFSAVRGSAPSRVLTLEWRARYYSGGGNANFELRLFVG